MFWITFATTRERVTPPAGQRTNVREELRELLHNWPWVVLLVASVFSTTFGALRSGSTLFYFKYVAGDSGTPFYLGLATGTHAPASWPRWLAWLAEFFLGLDRSTIFLTTGSLGLVLGTACLSSVARRIDKKYYAAALSAVTGVCFAAFFIVPADRFGLQLALNVLAQFCAGPTSALTWALYGDVADYGEWKFGRRSTGLIYSASLFSIKTGIVVGGYLLPLFLDRFGFVRNAVQTPRALLGITLAFSIAPALFALLKAGTLLVYPLNQRRVDQIEQDLAARRAASPGTEPA